MKVQSVSQLSSIALDDILADSTISAVIEVSVKKDDQEYYDSMQFDFKDLARQLLNMAHGINDLSNWVNSNFVHLTGDEEISGNKTFADKMIVPNQIAELSARHAQWS